MRKKTSEGKERRNRVVEGREGGKEGGEQTAESIGGRKIKRETRNGVVKGRTDGNLKVHTERRKKEGNWRGKGKEK